MAVGDAKTREDYSSNKAPEQTVIPLAFDEPLPSPTRDLDLVKSDLARAGYVNGACRAR